MKITLDSGGGNEETVLLREIHLAIVSTTLAAIQYDAGVIGAASIVLTDSPTGLRRNSLIQVDTEIVKVESITPSADGLTYSLRVTFLGTHIAGETVAGVLSWYIYTTLTHAAAESIDALYVAVSASGSGTAIAELATTLDASIANNRPISVADDFFHISVFLQNPQNVTSLVLVMDVGDGTFASDYWTWTIPASEFNQNGQSPGGNSWTDLSFALSTGVRTGNTETANFSTVAGLQVNLVTSGSSTYGFSDWYFFGTYGPLIQPAAPTGIVYESRFRDSSTGARSVPGPPTRYEVFPLRELVLALPPTTTAAGVNAIDIYRLGGDVTEFLFVGSVVNDPGSPKIFSDTLPDLSVLATNQPPELDKLQPWPLLALPWQGTVNVVGTSVTLVTGTPFDLNLLSASVIQINGIAYQTYGQPRSASVLELFTSGGVQNGVTFAVASPVLAAQSLPYAFGPLEGPFAPVIFGLGDPVNSGTLYWTNVSDADSASDQNNLELSPPSGDLISGATYNGLVFAGNRDDIFLVRYSFLQNSLSYQFQKIPSLSGMWSRWSCCTGPDGVYFLGRDGIYRATENGTESITDGVLYPLFPHDGQAARTVTIGTDTIQPVDMSRLDLLRLIACDQDLYFSFLDSTGVNMVTLRYEIPKKRWFLHSYGDGIRSHYLVEGSKNAPAGMQILLLSQGLGKIYLSGGNTDDGTGIDTLVVLPSFDGGDERIQKLYMDMIVQCQRAGTIQAVATFNNAETFSALQTITSVSGVSQAILNLSSLSDLSLYRNIGAKFAWTGGPDGPRIMAWEASSYNQPFLSKRVMTQFINLSFPGWKHHRRLYAGLISNSVTEFTIVTQDGRTYGPYQIPSSGGRFRIFPIILDHGIKDLAFQYSLDGGSNTFALFPEAFTIESKEWTEPSYIDLAVFKA